MKKFPKQKKRKECSMAEEQRVGMQTPELAAGVQQMELLTMAEVETAYGAAPEDKES